MFIYNQDNTQAVKASSISNFFVDGDKLAVYADCADIGDSLLLGTYKTLDGVIAAMNGAVEAVEAGWTYHMPAAD